MNSRMAGLLIGLGLVLASAVALQVVAARRGDTDERAPRLDAVIPAALPGWQVTTEKIADTAEMKRAVGELLNFDEGIWRTYRRGGQTFDIYAAYWRPGKMSHRLVAGHTPDVCWVASGWSLLEKNSGGAPAAVVALPVAQQRLFQHLRGERRYVWFWHLAGAWLVSYDDSASPPWWAVFSDLKRFGLNQKQSQYFVRISANVPFDELSGDAGFQATLKALQPLLEAR